EPEHEFSQFERLGEVVVGTELEPGGLVVDPVRGGEHQDRHAATRRDDALGDLITRRPRDVTIKNRDVVGIDAQQLQSALAVTAATALAAARRPLTGNGRTLNEDRGYPSPVNWPQHGQAALVLGSGRPAASPHEQPAPIASLAKVMTAYLTLKRYPLSGAQDGFTITVTQPQAQTETHDQS